MGEKLVETTINLHELAGIDLPLRCTVIEELENIRHVYTLRGMDFDIQEMRIQIGENPPSNTSQGGEK